MTSAIQQLLSTIYLGDRACKAVINDEWKERIGIQIDEISRLKPGTDRWDFYNDENIENGWLVFTGVTRFTISPEGAVPGGDWIELGDVLPLPEDGQFRVTVHVGCVDRDGSMRDGRIEIDAAGCHLEDPRRPGIEIRSERDASP